MATIINLTADSIVRSAPGIFVLAARLVVEKDSVEVINETASQNHNTANNISVARDALGVKLQKIIDDYVASKGILDSSQVTAALTQIENNLDVSGV